MATSVKDKFISTSAAQELSESFLEYSMSVVFSRAIPSIDGFKPVQRRILFGMWDSGWTNDKNFVKVSRVAGQVMGVLHPHGDSSISDALVKLAQPFYSKVPTVEGYGNFGDVSGSSPAAARYIECKLSKAAEFVLREIKEDTVDMKPNYDGTSEEPMLLPIMFPVLLVNGNFGIGVGFSNKIAPHNLREVIDGTKLLLKKPNASLDDVMKYIPGPDFPTGAEIIGTDGIRSAYETGQGVIRLRSKVTVKPTTRGKHELIFTEIPYGVKTESIIAKIKELIKVGKLGGLADAKDLTDRKNGLRVVIDVKAGVNPQALLMELYKETSLEESFGINSTVLVEGTPKTVGLIEMLQLFIDFRKETIRRRSEFRKKKRAHRLHIVEGLLKALANIDAVIKIVRGADDAAVAQEGLIKKFKVDEVQADYILSIPLRRLTKYDTIQLNDEKKRLEEEIKEIENILADPAVLTQVMVKELDEVKKALGEDRKSVIIGGSLAEHMEEAKTVVSAANGEVEDKPCSITLLASGSLVRTEDTYEVSGRGKIDPILAAITTTTRGKFVVITNKGRGFRVDAVHVQPDAKNTAKQLGLDLKSGERIIAVSKNVADTGEAGIALATKQGVVKVTNATDYPLRSDEFPVMSVEAGDEIIGGGWVVDAANTEFVFITSDSSLLRFGADKVRPQGSKGAGVAGIKLGGDAHVLAFNVLVGDERENADVVTSTGKNVKRTPFNLYPAKGRATGGVRSMKFLKGTTALQSAFVGVDVLAVDASGKKVDLPAVDNRRDGSGAVVSTAPVVYGGK